MKILDFLKGGTMNFQFNPAQLSRCQQNSLMDVLGVIQSENKNELVVTPVEFPIKLKVKLDDDIEMLLGWDTEKETYAGLTTPERLEQDIKELAKETVQEPTPEPESPNEPKPGLIKPFELPESLKDTVDLPTSEPDKYKDVDPMKLALLKYELMSTHLNIPDEKKIIFAKEYARLWSEHK